MLGVPVQVPATAETTALGAAYLAGLAVGYWKDQDEIAAQWKVARHFEPSMSHDQRDKLYHGWQRAVERSMHWIES
jgi:glycerol kinase